MIRPPSAQVARSASIRRLPTPRTPLICPLCHPCMAKLNEPNYLRTLCVWASLVAQLVKNLPQCKRPGFDSWVGKIPWRRDRLPTPVFLGFPCGSAGRESTCSVGDLGSIPGLGISPGEGKGYPLQYSGLDNSMDCRVHGITKSRTRLREFHFLCLYPFTSTSRKSQAIARLKKSWNLPSPTWNLPLALPGGLWSTHPPTYMKVVKFPPPSNFRSEQVTFPLTLRTS